MHAVEVDEFNCFVCAVQGFFQRVADGGDAEDAATVSENGFDLSWPSATLPTPGEGKNRTRVENNDSREFFGFFDAGDLFALFILAGVTVTAQDHTARVARIPFNFDFI